MEGKAALMHQFAGVSGFPIVLDERDPDALVETIKRFAPGFGAIHLEDIESPHCFEVEERVVAELEVPVIHDDQHGTAVAALAAAENASRRAGIALQASTVGVIGLGAADTAVARMIQAATEPAVVGFDPSPDAQARLAAMGGELAPDLPALFGAVDLVIAVSGRAGLIEKEWIRPGQGIMALTNPKPEIEPEEALGAGAAFAADGRSVNNLLGFPGILRGSLDTRARRISHEMYLAAAAAIAEHATQDELVPSPLRRDVHRAVARAVALAAVACGVARRDVPTDYMQVEASYRTLGSSNRDAWR